MILRHTRTFHALCLFLLCLCALPAFAQQDDFQAWLDTVKQEALARGISQATLDKALNLARPIDKVLELDQRQPEFVDTFWNYVDRRINPARIKKGRDLLDTHEHLLIGVENCYKVSPRFLVAFWALETNFGENTGGFPVIAALATLAYDARRAEFFRGELLAALEILDAGHIDVADMKGSWAGAMGQMQFMPSTFRHYAVDADQDGRADLWHTLPDAFASAANYLHQSGWQEDEIWGREVTLPATFDWRLAGLETRKSVKSWAALGVTQADGEPLPPSYSQGSVLLPQGHEGPAFLVYRNFEVIMAWNRSVNYALSVALLADRLRGMPSTKHGRQADNRRMTRDEAIEIQNRLGKLGFDIGKADGVIGARSRGAVRQYQETMKLPADGHASLTLLEYLRAQDSVPVAAPAPASPPAGSDASQSRQVTLGDSQHG
ncbi:MAG: lytic murein transglycosylase [Hydrogenophilales bacterium]|nr:lytic murein transglycosylase [Hydrogenophilales bacterium]